MTDLVPETVVDLDALADGEPAATEAGGPDVLDAVDEQLIDRLVGRARAKGLVLTGEGGLLAQLTKRLVESAWRVSALITSATASTTRTAGMAGTPATGAARRRC